MTRDCECKRVYGRLRNSQSQGLVEQMNGTMEGMITSYVELQTFDINKSSLLNTIILLIKFDVF